MRIAKKAFSLMLAVGILLTGFILPPSAPTAAAYDGPDPTGLPLGVINFNYDWKFYQPSRGAGFPSARSSAMQGSLNFYDIAYDDSAWDDVSVPHAINAGEAFTYSAGVWSGCYTGTVFYRKHFKLPQEYAGQKIFIEFESVRQAAYVYLNGKSIGYYEGGVVSFGFDLSDGLVFGDSENVLAVALDNRTNLGETRPNAEFGAQNGTGFQWNTRDFNPVQGGLANNVNLYIKGPVFQTLPLYANLRTKGTYVYPSSINVQAKTAVINVEAEVRNEAAGGQAVSLEVVLVDKDGDIAGNFASAAVNVPRATDIANNASSQITIVPLDANATTIYTSRSSTVIKASASVAGLNLWSPDDPYLYDVYSILKDSEGNIIDVVKITTGFRKVEYRGSTNGGVYINDKYTWLTGYAQRATNEWASIGIAPDWLSDYDMRLVKESNANHIRWMHVAPRPSMTRATDKYGVVVTCPGGDKEADVTGTQWRQRVELMRNVLIYYRNSPSVFFWEIGNASVTNAHLTDMMTLKQALDPSGFRAMGCRSLDNTSAADLVEYVATMLGRQVTTGGSSYTSNGRAIVDRKPITETEYSRDESSRRVWDRFSPPDYNLKNQFSGTAGTAGYAPDGWDYTQEEFIRQGVANYNEFYSRSMQIGSANPIYSAAAALCWTDSDQHGRMPATENGRMSGRVDPARIKKGSFYSYQAMQSKAPALYLVGHWSYPDPDIEGTYWYEIRKDRNDDGSALYPPKWTGEYARRDWTNKTVYVVASNVARVELYVNGVRKGTSSSPSNNFLYTFSGIDITDWGNIKAIGYDSAGNAVVEQTLETTGEPAGLRVTPVTAPDGLRADGSDIAYYDIEVVDAQGRVCPTNYDMINFTLIKGDAKIMGGYNSGLKYLDEYGHGYNKDYFYAECGLNRLFIKAGREAGPITISFGLEGKPATTVTINSIPLNVVGGLTETMPHTLGPDEKAPTYSTSGTIQALQPLVSISSVNEPAKGNLFDVTPNVAGDALQRVDVTRKTQYEGPLSLIAGAFDAEGYLLGASVEDVDQTLLLSVETGVPMNYVIPAGTASDGLKVFTWSSLSAPGIKDDGKCRIDMNYANYTGVVTMPVYTSGKELAVSIAVVKPGTDLSNIKGEDIAYLDQKTTTESTFAFPFQLPTDIEPGEYTVLVGAMSSAPTIAGTIMLYPGGLVVAPISATSPIVSEYDANVFVELDTRNLGGRSLTMELFGKSVPVINGIALFEFSASEVPVVRTITTYLARAYVDGRYIGVSLPVTVLPDDDSIWDPEFIRVGSDITRVRFFADIAEEDIDITVTSGGVAKSLTYTQVGNTILINYGAQDGDVFVISGVMYYKLFPSYSFSFTKQFEEWTFLGNLALDKLIRASTRELANPETRANDGDMGTRWAGSRPISEGPDWIEIDLGTAVNLDTVDMEWYAGRWYTYRIWTKTEPILDWEDQMPKSRNFASEGYTMVLDRSSNRVGGHTSDKLPAGTVARYILIDVRSGQSGNASIYEIEVSGMMPNFE